MTRGFVALLSIVLATGIGALAWATEGFRTVTSEGARQLAVQRHPIPLPDVRLVDQDGRAFSLADYRGRTVLVDFIYTRCPKLCGVLGDDFRRALVASPEAVGGNAAAFLSISFDRTDDRNALQLYADRYGAAAPRWRIAVPADASGLAALLRTFGVTVLSDGMGGFVHDGAIYLVDARGRLAQVLQPDAPQRIAGLP